MLNYTQIYPDGNIYHSDYKGEHHFKNKQEFDEYKKEYAKNLPILCKTCKYGKSKTECPLDMGLDEQTIAFGKAICCTYYTKIKNGNVQ